MKPKPLAICIEDLQDEGAAPRYLQCVATVGAMPGLTLSPEGRTLWCEAGGVCELWVSGDDKLMLFVPASHSAPSGEAPSALAATIVLDRRGRTLEAPREKPIVLRDGDELSINGHRLRLHIHGEAPEISAPCPVVPEVPAAERGLAHKAKAAVAALALGAAVGFAGPAAAANEGVDEGAIEVRTAPPKIAMPPKKPPKKPTKGKKGKKAKPGKKAKK